MVIASHKKTISVTYPCPKFRGDLANLCKSSRSLRSSLVECWHDVCQPKCISRAIWPEAAAYKAHQSATSSRVILMSIVKTNNKWLTMLSSKFLYNACATPNTVIFVHHRFKQNSFSHFSSIWQLINNIYIYIYIYIILVTVNYKRNKKYPIMRNKPYLITIGNNRKVMVSYQKMAFCAGGGHL